MGIGIRSAATKPVASVAQGPDQSTPQSTFEAMKAAALAGDAQGVLRLIYPAPSAEGLQEFVDLLQKELPGHTYTLGQQVQEAELPGGKQGILLETLSDNPALAGVMPFIHRADGWYLIG
jgi:hypothetical protein